VIWNDEAAKATPPGFRPRRLDIAGVLNAKLRAIACHRSQTSDLISDDPDGFRLEPAMLRRFERPWETYLEAIS